MYQKSEAISKWNTLFLLLASRQHNTIESRLATYTQKYLTTLFVYVGCIKSCTEKNI